jgi:hypothetical protein
MKNAYSTFVGAPDSLQAVRSINSKCFMPRTVSLAVNLRGHGCPQPHLHRRPPTPAERNTMEANMPARILIQIPSVISSLAESVADKSGTSDRKGNFAVRSHFSTAAL